MTVVWAGPFAAALLSDMGAEVIRVESAQRWDTIIRMAGDARAMRDHGSDVPLDAPPWEIGANWNTVGRNRKSVTMDLRRQEGLEAFYRLDRKSTRLNSSHSQISYAVFCLKKKKKSSKKRIRKTNSHKRRE